MKSIVVFSGSSEGNDPGILNIAYELGAVLASRQIKLIYGAAKIGVMGRLALGALDQQGEVVGVIPEFLKLKEVVHQDLPELITTETMHERKLAMYELCEGVITLPGGFGTLEELLEILTWSQLGLHQKPVGLLNINGFFDPLLHMFKNMVETGFLKQENHDLLIVENSIEGLLDKMHNYEPAWVPKWIKKEQL
ncbi:LOG family protein [Poritiphilus flavus]|uniref:Cytokinin riboside 5'-monophosphate phosphoribohydrolase n=1 Tax=Poritiphilus flavus TaxID=2697053 RepID=A0A6L9EF20_9FLAO|nr:TIGR00730 family Rossman fold protein [Poritiphilus flavus]NAS13370.1 TIGR00730 family Rossman fold protein [Poritiphilus flavus]